MAERTGYVAGTPSWVDLGSPDLDAAKAFYGGLFGWEFGETDPNAGGYTMATVRGKNVAGLLNQMDPSQPPFWATYVSVDDADGVAKLVADNGGTVLVPPMDVFDSGRMAVFLDPEGTAIGVWQPAAHIGAQLVNEHGTVTWNELATRDPDQAAAFYTTVFGWGADEEDFAPGVRYTQWKVGGESVGGMIAMDETWPAEIAAHWMVYFAVDDVDAAAAKVTDLGGNVHVAPSDIPPGRFSVVSDPQGTHFSLIKMNEPAS
ncbi:MAG: uncharacterized protein QOG03_1215 [Actinomycetota bacterium]|jgi:predicted enzyme related to lactoylglutathione lyase|nr:uncharacterized protein [Actinomycetota bacterium]